VRALGWRAHFAHEIDVDLDVAMAAAERGAALAAEAGDDDLAAWIAVQVARTLGATGRRHEAQAVMRPAVDRLDARGEAFWVGSGRYLLAAWALSDGRLDEAEDEAARCLAAMRSIGERWGLVIGLLIRAGLLEARGGATDAVPLYRDALAHAGEIGFELAEAHVRVRLAGLLATLGDHAEAAALCGEQLAVGRRTGDAHLIGFAGWSIGRLRRRSGDLEDAEALLYEALTNLRTIGSGAVPAVLHELGYVAEQRGDPDTARARHLEAGGDDDLAIAATLEGLAGVAMASAPASVPASVRASAGGAPTGAGLAATLLGAADAARERHSARLVGGARSDVDRIEDAARRALGDDAYDRAVAAGRALSAGDGLALALAGDGRAAPATP
jgi:tetratricopeptide (TPR) repeat protein